MTLGVSEEIIPGRSGVELLILSRLEQFSRSKIANLPKEFLGIKQFSVGHSNLTIQQVLKKMLGRVIPKDYALKRDYNILSEIRLRFKQAPKSILFSEGEMT